MDELLSDFNPWEGAFEDRPYVISNFVLSLDGRSSVGGVSSVLGSEVDTELLVGLRTRVDAVMIGGGTMRAERYGRAVPDPVKRERREREGLDADPLMVIVSGMLDLPWDAPLFEDAGAAAVIFTVSDAELPETPASVEAVRFEGELDLAEALRHLRRDRGVRALLCEGGAHLHGALHAVGCVDELFVTLAPKLVGGETPGLVAGLPANVRELELAWLVSEPETGELFARYQVVRAE